MDYEQVVTRHYAHGALETAILDALAASGKDVDHLVPADLSPVDEFHIGGRQATVDFADRMGTRPGQHLLDIGSGLGGPSRYFAQERGCMVSGIDLTEEYVRTADILAARVKLADRVSYRQGSALDLPFASASFDGAYMLHVGMNIADKAALFASVRRVLKSGGTFGIYDVMRDGEGELAFPVPWASEPATSFVETPATYRRLLEGAGFAVRHERNRRDFALEAFRKRALAAQDGPPAPLGLHIPMGKAAPLKAANMAGNIRQGLISPVEIVAEAV